MRYYLIAGEASGDLHGSNLMKELSVIDKDAEFRFWGGDLMAKYGGEPVKHINELAIMGFVKVLMNIKTILNNIKLCKKDIEKFNPDVVILIDYAGFNLKIAEFAHKKGFRVHYYIAPKLWAWKTYRIKSIKQYVDRMFSILPFETDFFNKYNFKVDYVGNPVNDEIFVQKQNVIAFKEFTKKNNLHDKPVVALLAGSRKQEISQVLPEMIKVSNLFNNYQFIIAGAPAITKDFYRQFIENRDVKIVYNQTYDLLKISKAAVVTSGTATLETALLEIPQVVCYKMNIPDFAFKLGRKLIKTKWISLVNLILNYEAVKELTQNNLNKKNIFEELNKILNDNNYRKAMLNSYIELKRLIGNQGASQKAAEMIYNDIRLNK
jgi:lipid-A-disaccharide synthase